MCIKWLKEKLGIAKKIEEVVEKITLEDFLNKDFQRTILIYKKRPVKMRGDVMNIPFDVRWFIRNYPMALKFNDLKEIWELEIEYTKDINQQGYVEYWQITPETLVLEKGDCEDSSILRVCLSRQLTKETAVALGLFDGGGHAFPVYFKNGKLYVVEATNNQYLPLEVDENMEALNGKYQIYYIFNEKGAWIINSDVIFGSKVKDELDVYEKNPNDLTVTVSGGSTTTYITDSTPSKIIKT